MPRFVSRTLLAHPLDDVVAWHARPGAFTRLTPPGYAVVRDGPTAGIEPGSTVTVRVTHPFAPGLGGMLPGIGGLLRSTPPGFDWTLVHGAIPDGRGDVSGFVDEQRSGPFASYRHEHRFERAPVPGAERGAPGAVPGEPSAVRSAPSAVRGETSETPARTSGDEHPPHEGTLLTDVLDWRLAGGSSPVDAIIARQFGHLFAFRREQLVADLALHAQLALPSLRIGITGASGTVGTQLAALASTGGHEIVRFVRGDARQPVRPGESRWDPPGGVIDHAMLASLDVVVHLAGATIAGRFTENHKRAILTSRIDGTTTLARALAQLGGDAPRLVQASAIGGYGARRPGELLTEDSPLGDGFLADVVRAWEGAAQPAVSAGVPTVFLRTGLVLTTGPGSLLPQVPLSLLGVGGRMTAPERAVSWITLDDLVRLYLFAAATPACEGPLNAVAPGTTTSAGFAAALGRVLHRPALLPVPAFGPAIVLGTEGADELVATDQRVSSTRATDAGFVFAHPDLDGALRHVLMRRGSVSRT